jgi:hypothetical protein
MKHTQSFTAGQQVVMATLTLILVRTEETGHIRRKLVF